MYALLILALSISLVTPLTAGIARAIWDGKRGAIALIDGVLFFKRNFKTVLSFSILLPLALLGGFILFMFIEAKFGIILGSLGAYVLFFFGILCYAFVLLFFYPFVIAIGIAQSCNVACAIRTVSQYFIQHAGEAFKFIGFEVACLILFWIFQSSYPVFAMIVGVILPPYCMLVLVKMAASTSVCKSLARPAA